MAKFSQGELRVIATETKAVSLKLKRVTPNLFAHKDGWRIRKTGKVTACSLFDGNDEVERYSSKTLRGLQRNIRHKLLNELSK